MNKFVSVLQKGKNDTLIVKIKGAGVKKYKYKYRLRRDGVIAYSYLEEWLDTNTMTFEIDTPGIYTVESWVSIPYAEMQLSNPVYFMPSTIQKEYEEWKGNFHAVKIPKLGLYKPVHPFGNLVLIKNLDPKKRQAVECYANSNDLEYKYYQKQDAVILSSLKACKDANDTEYYFSGITKNSKQLIIGANEAQACIKDANELKDQIGEYTLLVVGDEIEFSTDYFGLNRLYYFKAKGAFISSNSYQLLLIILKLLGHKLRLHEDKVKAQFLDVSHIFENNWTWQMDVEKVFELPIDKKFVIEKNGAIKHKETEIYYDLRNRKPFSEKEYEELLFKAKDEIIDNLTKTFEHSSFKNVRIDLSGGMDSRLVYETATNLPDSMTNRLYIRTEPYKTIDFEIANRINNIYKFKWDTLHVTYSTEGCQPDNVRNMPQGRFLGTSFDGWVERDPSKISDTIHITGGCGEFCARPFMRYWYPDAKNIEDILINYKKRKDNQTLYPPAGKTFCKMLTGVLKYLPGASILEKFDNHNLYFQNGYHFSLMYHCDITCTAWTVLQSKSCFRAKNMAWTVAIDMKVQHDLLNIMNPVVSQIKYAADRQNAEKIEIKNRLYNNGVQSEPFLENNNTDDFTAANENKLKNETFIPDVETFMRFRETQISFYDNDDTLLSCLYELINYAPEYADMGVYLYYYIKYASRNKILAYTRRVFANHILSIYHQIQILAGAAPLNR